MIVRCSKCSTEFDLNPQQVGPDGVTLRCSVCGHMFHAEPNPAAGLHQPWQLCNTENHLFTLPDLESVVGWIEDGRLRPDDQISRTGQHWLRLGDLPELSTIFVGFDGLPRVFRARELPPAGPQAEELGPPPAFGEGLDAIPDFGVGNAPDESASQSMPASMLDAVTKAVAAPPMSRAAAPDDTPQRRVRSRSQPILVADLAGESVASGEIPDELATATATEARPAAAPATPIPSDAPAEGAPSTPAEVESLESLESPGTSETSETSHTSYTPHTPEMITPAAKPVPPPEEARSSGLGWLALLAVAAVVVILAVPELRAKVLGDRVTPSVAPTVAPVENPRAVEAPPDLRIADEARKELSLDGITRAQATLQRMIDAREGRGQAIDPIKLAQVELLLTRALALRIALTLDPTAIQGTAQSRAAEDERWATDLLGTIDPATVDGDTLRRVQTLQALVDGRLAEAPHLVPPMATELALVVKAAPLWGTPGAPVPAGLIAGLQTLPDPSTLARSLHTLALWRSGDLEGAQRQVVAINRAVADQPLAQTLERALVAALEAAGEEPEETTPAPEPAETSKRPRPRPAASDEPDDPATLTPRGCERIRSGDATGGVKLLLAAIDANTVGFDTYMCLGEGYTKMGNDGSALSFYERAVKLAPKNRDALRGAAGLAAKLNRSSQAVGYYKRLLALDPGDQAAKSYLQSQGVALDPSDPGGQGPGGEEPSEDDSGASPFLPLAEG